MVQTAYSTDDQPPVQKRATSARQGMWGRHVLWVLIISFALAAIALFGSWAMHANELAQVQDTGRENAAEARSFAAPELTTKQTD